MQCDVLITSDLITSDPYYERSLLRAILITSDPYLTSAIVKYNARRNDSGASGANRSKRTTTSMDTWKFCHSTKKRQHYFHILKAFLSDTHQSMKTSDNDLKVNRNIYPDAVTSDRMRLIGAKCDQLGPISHCLLEESQ